jgi:chromate transporter
MGVARTTVTAMYDNARKKIAKVLVEAIVLIDLFLTFAKIGIFTFGGGYAMISLIENACVDNKKWITHDEMMNITVIAESTPGSIAINCATYVGYELPSPTPRRKRFLLCRMAA